MESVKLSVLLIDDDELTHLIHRTMIKQLGVEIDIIAYTDAEEALMWLQEPLTHWPDVIFLDINMPEMDGWQFLDAYVNLTISPNTQLYMLTSSIDQRDINKSKTYCEVRGFISKPLMLEDLRGTLGLYA